MDRDESKQILDYLKRIDESINGPRTRRRPAKDKRPLSDRVDSVEKKVDQLEKKVDSRFHQVDQKIDSARVEIVDLVTRVHDEVTGRIVDLEKAGPGRKGNGGRGSGGGGVPLAS